MADNLPPGAAAAIAQAVAAYEPEAAAAVIASPGQFLSVLLEAARRAAEATEPHIVATAASAELERIRQLAIAHDACYPMPDGEGMAKWVAFADLIGDDND